MELQQRELVVAVVEEQPVNLAEVLEEQAVVALEEIILEVLEQLEQLIQVVAVEVWVLRDLLDNLVQYLEMVVQG